MSCLVKWKFSWLSAKLTLLGMQRPWQTNLRLSTMVLLGGGTMTEVIWIDEEQLRGQDPK